MQKHLYVYMIHVCVSEWTCVRAMGVSVPPYMHSQLTLIVEYRYTCTMFINLRYVWIII